MNCPVFEKFGFCHYGISCLFANSHVIFNEKDRTYQNKKLENSKLISDFEFNRLNPLWQTMMRDSRFSFPKTRKAMEDVSFRSFF